jgi:hypothetical protein
MRDFVIIFMGLCGGVIIFGFVGAIIMKLIDHFLR